MNQGFAEFKTCPQCGRLFSRRALHLTKRQWKTRRYCGIKCSSKAEGAKRRRADNACLGG